MGAPYVKLSLNKVLQENSEEISCDLFKLGALGVVEKLDFTQTSKKYEPKIISHKWTALEAFFLLKDKEKVQTHLQEYNKLEATLLLEPHKDWLMEWKKHYKPFCVIGNLWVYPSWEKENIKNNEEVILVDPGLAFGTGTHPTTKLCLIALLESLNFKNHGLSTALDMGSGTGILSSLMFKRGVLKVTACEIDEMARKKCQENLKLNNCSKVLVVAPEFLNTQVYDLVVANIIDGVLLEIKKDLIARTKKKLILSGILLENEENILNEFLKEKELKLFKRTLKDQWVCLEFIKNA